MNAIGQVLAPATVRPGETCEVRVLDGEDAPLSEFGPLEISINAQCGPHQFLQFPGTGRYQLTVTARDQTGVLVDTKTVDVVVAGESLAFDAEGGRSLSLLQAIPDLGTPYRFTFRVGQLLPQKHPDWVKASPMSPDRTYNWEIGNETFTTRVPWIEHDLLWKLDHQRRWTTRTVSCRITPDEITVKRTLTSTSSAHLLRERGFVVPIVRNDLNVDVGEGAFTCTAYVHNVGDEFFTLEARSITPHSLDQSADIPGQYLPLGEKPMFEPRTAGVLVTQLRGGIDVPWSATGVTIRFAGQTNAGIPVRLSATFDLPLRPRELPHRIDVGAPETWPWDDIKQTLAVKGDHAGPVLGDVMIDPLTGTISGSIQPTTEGLSRLTEMGETISSALRAPFVAEALEHGVPGAVLVLAAANQGSPPGSMTVMSGDGTLPSMPVAGPVAEGQICDPDNIGDADQATANAGKLACTLGPTTVSVTRPGRWVRARKGDVILSPGDSGSLVADVLAAVTPSQPFSHSGIMTRNYEEITHSTASEAWLLEHLTSGWPSDGSDGLQPQALRYVWPGVVAQSAQASIEGEDWVAPDNGATYSISSFSPVSGTTSGFAFMPALHVQPDPVLEAAQPSVRAALHRVADGVRTSAGRPARGGQPGINSKSHYRFYCFTDPMISESEIVAPGNGWASGTFPAVCSVLIWREMRKQGLHMEGPLAITALSDLEPDDIRAGAMAALGTPDGLYTYTAQERQDAAQKLFNKVRAKAYEQAGFWGEALTDASDDTANQVVSTFASDNVNGKDSDELEGGEEFPSDWHETGPSNAVSPANIVWWDGPDRGGSYGFAEPAIYVGPHPEQYRISTWHRYDDDSVISGVVSRPDGTPVPKALVQVVDGRVGGTDATGAYIVGGVPYVIPDGSEYSLTAAVVVDGELFAANRTVLVNGKAIHADIVLDAPPSTHRRVTIVAAMRGGDDEDIEADESYSHNNGPEEIELSKDMPYKVLGAGHDPTFRWGGEVRAEHTVEVSLMPGASVLVEVVGQLYEGTSTSTSDKDFDGETMRKVVGPNATETLLYRMWNKDDNEADTFSELTLTITNQAWG